MTTIYKFTNTPDGNSPRSSLTPDAQGRLYGTTAEGGLSGAGTVFRLSLPASEAGPWTEEVLHSFIASEGTPPISPVNIGSTGDVFGTTLQGGPLPVDYTRGTIYKLQNVSGWPLTLLHVFGQREGGYTSAGLVPGLDGLLYGTTPAFSYSKTPNLGTAFTVSPLGDSVEYAVVHRFGTSNDGYSPTGLTLSPSGTFFGTTSGGPGQTNPRGTVFSLHSNLKGRATEKILYSFGAAPDVSEPLSPPIFGAGTIHKSLFGCGITGGAHGHGGIYRLTPTGAASWTETVIYNFGDQPNDPSANYGESCDLVQGNAAGTLYGVSTGGGALQGGTFFEISPPATTGANWTETVLISFDPSSPKGFNPSGAPLKMGNLYYGSLTSSKNGYGAIYRIRP